MGIPNYGNTCYLNSILQILFITPEFADSISNCFGLYKVFYSLRNPNINLEPKIKNFLENLSREHQMVIFKQFALGNQNDCKELYNILIEELAKENSSANKFFKIFKQQQIKCSMNHCEEKSEESYFTVFPKHCASKISDYLKYLENEKNEFDENNSLWCNKCNALRPTVIKTISLELPQIFAVYTSGITFKNIKSVENFNFKGKNFELYGVICYYEHVYASHYIAFTLDKDRKWREYNDVFVSDKAPDMKYAYMLFYRLNNK